MNLWFISKYASPPQYSKMPSRLFHLAREISSLRNNVLLITSDSNHFSTFPKSDHTYNDEYTEGVQIRWLKTFKYVKTSSIKRIASWFDFEIKLFRMRTSSLPKPDVIHISSLSIFTILYGYYLKRKFNSFLVFEVRDIWPLTMTEEAGFSRYHPLVLLIGWIEKFGYRRADLIVGTMPNLNQHVFERIGVHKPFYCLPMGFNEKDYKGELNVSSPLDGKMSGKTIIGYAGSFGITNALETFIEVIRLMKEHPEVLFVLVGSGDLKERYKKVLDGYTNVLFLDRMEQDNIKYFLANCDILYLSTKPSKVWNFGQSMNKVVEYMLAAKPIVASYTGYPSMINEAECGTFLKGREPEELKKVFLKYVDFGHDERVSIGLRGKEWIVKNRSYRTLAHDYLHFLNMSR